MLFLAEFYTSLPTSIYRALLPEEQQPPVLIIMQFALAKSHFLNTNAFGQREIQRRLRATSAQLTIKEQTNAGYFYWKS